MTDLERELLALVLEQAIMIRDLKVKIRVINPEGEFYSPEDWRDCSASNSIDKFRRRYHMKMAIFVVLLLSMLAVLNRVDYIIWKKFNKEE